MKTKKIILIAMTVLVGALISTPAYAQLDPDDLEYMEITGDTIKQAVNNHILDSKTQKEYLDVIHLSETMTYNDIDEEDELYKIGTQAKNSIEDKKITDQEQYDLIVSAITTKNNKVLKTLVNAGFFINVDIYLKDKDQNIKLFLEILEERPNDEAYNFIYLKKEAMLISK